MSRNMDAATAVTKFENNLLFVLKNGQGNSGQNRDRLELRFDRPLKDNTANGWQFGNSAERSDVVVQTSGNVGEQYFSLALADDCSIWMCRTSKHKITVWLYHERALDTMHNTGLYEMEPRQDEPLMVCRPPHGPHHWSHFDILVDNGAKFTFFFPNHTPAASQEYMNNLHLWVKKRPLPSPGRDSTVSTTLFGSNSESPLVFRDDIGSGGFGSVELCVDMCTGHEAAMKTSKMAMNAPQNNTSTLDQKASHETANGSHNAFDRDFKKAIEMMKKCIHVSFYGNVCILMHNQSF